MNYDKNAIATIIAQLVIWRDDHKNPMFTDTQGRTPLHKAVTVIQEEDKEQILRCISHCLKDLPCTIYDKIDTQGRSPFFSAMQANNQEAAKLFLKEPPENCDITRQDRHGRTVLHYAAMHGALELVQLICQRQVRDGIRNIQDKERKTALHYAARLDKIETFILLIEYGATFNVKDNEDLTAVDHALIWTPQKTLKMRDTQGRTLLHYAVQQEAVGVVQRLIRHGADPNVQDNDKHTPLHYAYAVGNTEVITLLYEATSRSSIAYDSGLSHSKRST